MEENFSENSVWISTTRFTSISDQTFSNLHYDFFLNWPNLEESIQDLTLFFWQSWRHVCRSFFFFLLATLFFLSRRLKLTFQTLEFDIGTTVIIINYQQCWSIFTFRKKLVNFSLEFHSKKKKDICWWFFFLTNFLIIITFQQFEQKSFLSEPLNFRGLLWSQQVFGQLSHD